MLDSVGTFVRNCSEDKNTLDMAPRKYCGIWNGDTLSPRYISFYSLTRALPFRMIVKENITKYRGGGGGRGIRAMRFFERNKNRPCFINDRTREHSQGARAKMYKPKSIRFLLWTDETVVILQLENVASNAIKRIYIYSKNYYSVLEIRFFGNANLICELAIESIVYNLNVVKLSLWTKTSLVCVCTRVN